MAALNFPDSPSLNQIYIANDTTWQWNGSSWVRINTGVQGTLGPQGTQGTQGVQGSAGFVGSDGAQGTQGIQGPQGTQGTQGTQGIQGVQGIQGIQGTQGIQGVQGVQGTQGAQGIQGIQGTQGFGLQGTQGTQGTQASQGIQGTQGLQGSNFNRTEYNYTATVGQTTFSATYADGTDIDVYVNGVRLTPAEYTATSGTTVVFDVACVGGEIVDITTFTSAGPQGTQGALGTQGVQGVQGPQGIQGIQGFSFQRTNYSFTATANQTSFAVTYSSGTNIDVYVNGAHLGPSDYTATSGTAVVLNDPSTAGDSVEISTYESAGPQGTQGVQGVQGSQGTQGVQGIQGLTGVFGGATFDYTFDSSTTNSDPGVGKLRFNNANLTSATRLYIDDTDDNSTNIDNFLQTIDDSTSTIKGHFRVSNKANTANFALYTISALTDNGGYYDVLCSYVSGSVTTFSDTDIVITFARTGDKGDTGAQGTTGTQGLQGATGTQGIQGIVGLAGETKWATNTAGISTTAEVGINTTTIDNPALTGVGNSFQGLYVSNGMIIYDNNLNGNHYIGTAFNGLMAGPVNVNGSLTIDGVWVVV